MRIARVYMALDRETARERFQRGLNEVRTLSGQDREDFLEEARILAAAVAPELMGEAVGYRHRKRPFETERIGRTMLEHGNVEAAFDYVMKYEEDEQFPYSTVSMLMPKLADESKRLAVFQKALAVGKNTSDRHFVMFFVGHWASLPVEEAREIVRKIVQKAIEEPDQPITASYDPERTVEITSAREHTFFQLLHILRRVDNELAESLISRYAQLAAAARHFPNGMESAREAAEKRRREIPVRGGGGGGSGRGILMGGNPKDFPYMMALVRDREKGQFDSSISYAIEKLAEDSREESPNLAPKYFWPSTGSFRQVLYAAGKRLGEDAARYLEKLGDEDVRLFAEIEMLAAIAGLPELNSMQRKTPAASRAGGARIDRGNPIPNVRCPKCKWQPREGDRWACRCGHVWNTFHTRGKCPSCGYQWNVTGCFGCGESSRHEDWYTS